MKILAALLISVAAAVMIPSAVHIILTLPETIPLFMGTSLVSLVIGWCLAVLLDKG